MGNMQPLTSGTPRWLVAEVNAAGLLPGWSVGRGSPRRQKERRYVGRGAHGVLPFWQAIDHLLPSSPEQADTQELTSNGHERPRLTQESSRSSTVQHAR